MAVFSRKHNYLFLASPQTGSKAINKTLLEQLDGEQMPGTDVRRNRKVIARKHHTTCKMLRNAALLTPEEIEGAFKFTGVRNPYDLLVSRYLKMRGRFSGDGDKAKWAQKNPALSRRVELANTLSFPAWLAEEHKEFTSGEKVFKGPMLFLVEIDHVIRFEHLQADFDDAMRRIGIGSGVSVAPHNVSNERASGGSKKDYREFYDEASIRLVKRLYAPVIERFDYSFDPKVPARVEEREWALAA